MTPLDRLARAWRRRAIAEEVKRHIAMACGFAPDWVDDAEFLLRIERAVDAMRTAHEYQYVRCPDCGVCLVCSDEHDHAAWCKYEEGDA